MKALSSNRYYRLLILTPLLFTLFFSSCSNKKQVVSNHFNVQKWDLITLKNRATANQDSSKWNQSLLEQDLETYHNYADIFEKYPLNNYPFPVADYDYSVYSNPFTLEVDSFIFKGIQIGEYINPNSDSVTTKLTLLVLTNSDKVEPESFVDSRNYPYLTAEGYFNLPTNNFNWVFSATPDGFSSLFFSMKFFDLRFGETIIIYPQSNNSFLYEQLEESPNNYSNFDEYMERIKENVRNRNISR